MISVSPALTDAEVASEQVIALDQPEYYPIIVARIVYSDGTPASVTRFKFSDEERKLVASGADLLLSQPHHGSLMPIGIEFAMPNAYPVKEGK